jgi:hypothetical protein
VELLRLSGRRRGGAALGAPRRAVPCGVGEAVRARLTVVPDQERVLAQGLVDDVDGPIVGDPRPGEAVEGMGRPPDTIPALRRGVPRLGDPGGDHLVARGVRGAREDLPVVHRRRRGRSAEARVEEGVDGSGLARPVPHGQLGPRRRARAGVRWGARVRRGRVRRGARVRLGRAGVFRLGRAGVLRPGEAGVGRRGSRVQREPRVGLGHRRAVDGDASELWAAPGLGPTGERPPDLQAHPLLAQGVRAGGRRKVAVGAVEALRLTELRGLGAAAGVDAAATEAGEERRIVVRQRAGHAHAVAGEGQRELGDGRQDLHHRQALQRRPSLGADGAHPHGACARRHHVLRDSLLSPGLLPHRGGAAKGGGRLGLGTRRILEELHAVELDLPTRHQVRPDAHPKDPRLRPAGDADRRHQHRGDHRRAKPVEHDGQDGRQRLHFRYGRDPPRPLRAVCSRRVRQRARGPRAGSGTLVPGRSDAPPRWRRMGEWRKRGAAG